MSAIVFPLPNRRWCNSHRPSQFASAETAVFSQFFHSWTEGFVFPASLHHGERPNHCWPIIASDVSQVCTLLWSTSAVHRPFNRPLFGMSLPHNAFGVCVNVDRLG